MGESWAYNRTDQKPLILASAPGHPRESSSLFQALGGWDPQLGYVVSNHGYYVALAGLFPFQMARLTHGGGMNPENGQLELQNWCMVCRCTCFSLSKGIFSGSIR